MRSLFTLLLLGICSTYSIGQEFSIGFLAGVESRSSMRLHTPEIGLIARGKHDQKSITPEIGFRYYWSSRISTSIGIGYRSETLSVSAWNPQADTCSLCPLIIGGGPSAREVRFRPEAGLILSRGPRWQLNMSLGIVWALRFDLQSNLSKRSGYLSEAFESITESLRYNPFYTHVGLGYEYGNITLGLRYEHTRAYSRFLNLWGHKYSWRSDESRFLIHLAYRIGVGSG